MRKLVIPCFVAWLCLGGCSAGTNDVDTSKVPADAGKPTNPGGVPTPDQQSMASGHQAAGQRVSQNGAAAAQAIKDAQAHAGGK